MCTCRHGVTSCSQNSGAVWKSRWPSWDPVPSKPTVSVMVTVYVKLELKPSELRSCVEVEVAVLGSPSLISLMVSVDVKQH